MSPSPSHSMTSVDVLKSWLVVWLANELGMDRESIDPSQPFLSYGMDSVQAMSLVGDLEAKLEQRLPPTLAWDFPDINTLAQHLADRLAGDWLESRPHSEASRAEAESLLATIDQVSDQDVELLLARYQGKS